MACMVNSSGSRYLGRCADRLQTRRRRQHNLNQSGTRQTSHAVVRDTVKGFSEQILYNETEKQWKDGASLPNSARDSKGRKTFPIHPTPGRGLLVDSYQKRNVLFGNPAPQDVGL